MKSPITSRRQFLKYAGATLPMLAVPTLISSKAFAGASWDLGCEYNATSYPVQLAQKYADLLKESTKDEVAITIHPGASLGYKSADQFYAVADGALAMGFTLLTGLGGIDPLFEISSLPFLAMNLKEAEILASCSRTHLSTVFEKSNQVQLFAETDPGSGIWAKKPIQTKADLAGLRIRTFDANSTRTMAAAGAVPFQLPWADVVPQLAAGAIDAVLTSAEGGTLISLWEYTPYFNELNYSMPLHSLHVNADVLGEVSTEQQAAVLSVSDELQTYVWQNQQARIDAANQRIVAEGATLVGEFSSELTDHLRAAGEQTQQTWLERAGSAGAALIEDYRKALA